MVAALAAALILAASTGQFDLDCAGMETVQGPDGAQTSRPYAKTWVIDLDAGTFCGRGCHAAGAIAHVNPAEIVLSDELGVLSDHLAVNRTTGELHGRSTSPGRITDVSAACKLSPFTGLPARAF